MQPGYGDCLLWFQHHAQLDDSRCTWPNGPDEQARAHLLERLVQGGGHLVQHMRQQGRLIPPWPGPAGSEPHMHSPHLEASSRSSASSQHVYAEGHKSNSGMWCDWVNLGQVMARL